MACKLLERDEVPDPPHRVFNGVVDEKDCRWRFQQGLLIRFFRYLPDRKQRRGLLPWAELWVPEDARR